MEDNNVNVIKRPILVKHMYPCINLNDIADNATTKIKMAAKVQSIQQT
jgi:hypothetical protein